MKISKLIARRTELRAQRKSLKAAIKTAAKAPVANFWVTVAAAPVAEAEAEALAAVAEAALVAEPALEAAAEDDAADEVEAAEEAPPAEVCARASAVALRVPHFWLSVQVCCPCASMGWAIMHCWKVA